MKCPQCGAQTPDEEWNCGSCRMNVYWASQHYDDLAGIRRQQGLRDNAETPSFLRLAHAAAMDERAGHGGKAEHRVRQIARRVMRETGWGEEVPPAGDRAGRTAAGRTAAGDAAAAEDAAEDGW